jgi:hypothetical protein
MLHVSAPRGLPRAPHPAIVKSARGFPTLTYSSCPYGLSGWGGTCAWSLHLVTRCKWESELHTTWITLRNHHVKADQSPPSRARYAASGLWCQLVTGLEKLEDLSEPKCAPSLLANMWNWNSLRAQAVPNSFTVINKSIYLLEQETESRSFGRMCITQYISSWT